MSTLAAWSLARTVTCASIRTDGRLCGPVTSRRSALACHSAAGNPVLRDEGLSMAVTRAYVDPAPARRLPAGHHHGDEQRYGRCGLAAVLGAAAAAAAAAAPALAQPRSHHRRCRVLRARQRGVAAALRRQLRPGRLPGAAGRSAPPARDRGGPAARPPARRPL